LGIPPDSLQKGKFKPKAGAPGVAVRAYGGMVWIPGHEGSGCC